MSRPTKERSGRRARPPQGRRKPPPESTGQERRFLGGQMKSGNRVGIQLRDGTRSEGVVRAFDERQIEIGNEEHPPIIVRKSQIRYIEEL